MSRRAIGICAIPPLGQGVTAFFASVQAAGLTHVELRVLDQEGVFGLQSVPSIRQALAGVPLATTVHAPWQVNPAASDEQERRAALQQYRMALDIAAALGSERVVVHGGFHADRAEGQRQSRRSLRELVQYAADVGVRTALENDEVSRPTVFQHPADFDCVLDLDLDFVMDVGHAHTMGYTFEDFLPAMYGRLVEVHLHDNRGRQDEHLPLGAGSVPWEPLLHWAESEFSGLLMLEVRPGAALRRSLSYLEHAGLAAVRGDRHPR